MWKRREYPYLLALLLMTSPAFSQGHKPASATTENDPPAVERGQAQFKSVCIRGLLTPCGLSNACDPKLSDATLAKLQRPAEMAKVCKIPVFYAVFHRPIRDASSRGPIAGGATNADTVTQLVPKGGLGP